MAIKNLILNYGVPDFKRNGRLDLLKVDSLLLRNGTTIGHLELPIDNLRYLEVGQFNKNETIRDITLPLSDVSWTSRFEL
ncbi:hypothetical protein N7447_008370 [Penicillium robsamsonii]|uniref:uncharacterized protein n=1 Tax=Penicillium robsamsonii TaxID=1792511 RepID=UPI0025480D1B|nr:uncharacterized protein N7447_008370 [Penicillium robsamsonii]KAJ5816137.1 hypothetical protein N7447_008370 [Penicillium robsamsonii]